MKIAYIGGGSRQWARSLMMDLALCPELSGEVSLFDIDFEAAQMNATLGNLLQTRPEVVSNWQYRVAVDLTEALRGANFVVISIQPAPLDVMRSAARSCESSTKWAGSTCSRRRNLPRTSGY